MVKPNTMRPLQALQGASQDHFLQRKSPPATDQGLLSPLPSPDSNDTGVNTRDCSVSPTSPTSARELNDQEQLLHVPIQTIQEQNQDQTHSPYPSPTRPPTRPSSQSALLPALHDLDLAKDEDLDIFMGQFAWSEDQRTFNICTLQKTDYSPSALVSDRDSNPDDDLGFGFGSTSRVSLTLQTGVGSCLVGASYDEGCTAEDDASFAHAYIMALHTRPAPDHIAASRQVVPPVFVVCVGRLRVTTSASSLGGFTDFAVLVSPFPTHNITAQEAESSSSSSSSTTSQPPHNGGFWIMFRDLEDDDDDEEEEEEEGDDHGCDVEIQEEAYKSRLGRAFHQAFGGLGPLGDAPHVDLAYIAGDWREMLAEPEKGLGAPEEIAAGFNYTAGHLFHPYLTPVKSDKVNAYKASWGNTVGH
ncbi:hypothetical protein SLS53_008718 [Cytospora paraplurivora]|uniref:Uncharacterized protein n=1 Tax=Cytospora paraplurivora TaxID=2898453 RepID=A0AAN9YCJ2_9PEZI